jgi:hypothetical protein
MDGDEIHLPPLGTGLLRLAAKLALIAAIAWGSVLLLDWADARAHEDGSRLMAGVLIILLVAYALLLAIPFAPGIEVGVALLMAKGADIAPFVYLATVSGLAVAFLAGRLLPERWLAATFADLRLARAASLVLRLSAMTREQRLAHLTERLPRWLAPFVGPWRYLLLALLLNVPGNAAVGGGGGIAFAAGFSRLFHPGWSLLAFVLGVAPVPIGVWFLGVAPNG